MSTAKSNTEKAKQLLEQIRQVYRTINAEYGLEGLGNKFEQRYQTALNKNIAGESFLQNEAQLACELRESLQTRAHRRAETLQKYFSRDGKEDLSEKYPLLESFTELDSDVGMLYSGIHRLLTRYWKAMKFYIEGTIQHHNLARFERDISSFYSEDIHVLPYNIRSYLGYLENQTSHIQRLRRSQQVLQEAGLWLNGLSEILILAKLDEPMPPQVEEAETLLHGLISDFRLKIFTQRGRG